MSITEAEDQIEKRVDKKTKQRIQAVHRRVCSFELRVLAHLALTIELISIVNDVASVRVHVNTILEIRGTDPKSEHVEIVEDRVLATLLTTPL